MAQVAIEKTDSEKTAPASVANDLKALSNRIRQRAFELFERRGGIDGFAVNDWLTAEQDLLHVPQSELVEKDGVFKVRLNAAGFQAGDLNVVAEPGALIVKASASHENEKNEENVHFSEFAQKMLFRRFDLPEAITVDKVSASLENGVLQVVAPKAKQEPGKVQPGAETTKTSAAV